MAPETKQASRSPFAIAAPDLTALGFNVVPLAPEKKFPAKFSRGEWRPEHDWQRFRDRKPTDFEFEIWQEWDGTNVGIVCGSIVGDSQIVAIDIDTDDYDEINEIVGALPASPMAKKGQKGLTLFYRGSMALTTRKYDRDGRKSLCEILTGRDTRQTVVPPSIHPITQTAYVWTRGPIDARDLPALGPEDVEALEETLQSLGWDPLGNKTDRAKHVGKANSDWLSTPFVELNRAALDDLDAWVHELDLYGLKPARRGYEAVNTFRNSSTGRPVEKRKRNLSIQPSGISDWGSNERFSPIDLVMQAKGWSFDDAFVWLHTKIFGDAPAIIPEALQPKEHTFEDSEDDDDNVVDFEALIANAEKKKATPVDDDGAPIDVAPDDDHTNDAPIFPPIAADAKLERWTEPAPSWLVKQIVKWITVGAARPMPAIANATAVTLLGTAIGRQYKTFMNGSTLLYTLLLAPTGAGKNRPLMAPARIFSSANLPQLIGPASWTAGSVLDNELKANPVILCAADEYADQIARMLAYNAPNAERSKLGALKQLWSINFDDYKTQSMAQTQATSIHAPHPSILAAATPGKFYSTLTPAQLEDGFLNRWLVINEDPLEDEDAVRQNREMLILQAKGEGIGAGSSDAPREIVEAVRQIHTRRDRQEKDDFPPSARAVCADVDPKPEIVRVSTPALEFFLKYVDFCNELASTSEHADKFYRRAAEMALRISTILAVSAQCDPSLEAEIVEVDLDEMRWSIRFVDFHIRQNLREATARMNAGRNAELINRLIEYFGRKNGQWVERRQIVNRFMREVRSSRELDEFLQTLIDAGTIASKTAQKRKGGGGRATVFFKLIRKPRA